MSLNDCIRKVFHEELNTPYKPNTGHGPEVFIIQMEGVGTVRVGGPLHADAPARASR